MNDKILPFDKEQLSDASLDRIMAMSYQKAGIPKKERTEMEYNYSEPIITMKRSEENKTDKNIYVSKVKSRKGGVAAACIALLLVGTASGLLFFGKNLETEPPHTDPAAQFASLVDSLGEPTVSADDDKALIELPDVVGMEESKACQTLLEAGFLPIKREMYDDKVEAGHVIKTDPEAALDKRYEMNTEVTYYVSLGPLDGSSAGTTESDSVTSDKPDTIETSVSVDTTVPEQITPDVEKVTLPDVVGLSQEKAIAALEECGLDYKVVEIKYYADKGKVIEQSIASGTVVDKDTVITIYISTGDPEIVEMTMQIPIPEGAKGSYTFDVYREGTVIYTKTVTDMSLYAGKTVDFDIYGTAKEVLHIYVKNNDLGWDNYFRYAVYNIDYDNKTVQLDGELNEKDFLDPPKQWDDLSGFDDLG
ncbi:MAG: PASTA domain-containing protein [Ruminococcus sp.]|nr:PASTA domain-containing protein [Ruminococcus sp.]